MATREKFEFQATIEEGTYGISGKNIEIEIPLNEYNSTVGVISLTCNEVGILTIKNRWGEIIKINA